LIWRSRTTVNGTRRVNYYVKHLLTDEDGNFSKTLSWITAIKDPKLVCHPVVVLVADIVWSNVAVRSFLYGRSWHLFKLVIFLVVMSILEHLHSGPATEVERYAIFLGRAFIYVLTMPQHFWTHTRDTTCAYKKGDTIKLGCLSVPRYLRQWQSFADFFLTLCLVAMLVSEPILWCYKYQHGVMFDEMCPEMDYMRLPYTIFAMLAMFSYYLLLIDLTIVSTTISAFVLVCVRMLSEVALALGALAVAVLTFSSAASVLKQENADFAGIHKGAFALFRMIMRAYDAQHYEKIEDEPTLLVMIFVFMVVTVIFFLNMLIAQLSCAYGSVYEDMVGYARLERAEKTVEIVPSVPKQRWIRFIDSLRLNKRLEFGQGDIGVAGGVQMFEAANMHPTTVDMIRRYGGSTSQEAQWPEDEEGDGGDDDRFERMEKLIQRTLTRVTKGAKGSGMGSSGGGGSAGAGTGSGSGSAASDASGAGDNDV